MTGSRPRVGVVAGWFDPDDPSVWSGVPAAILRELRQIADFAGVQNATPYKLPGKAIYRVRFSDRLGRTGDRRLWSLNPEMRLLSRLTAVGRRWHTPGDIDAWLHLCGSYGRFVRGRYVTLSELSPSRLSEYHRWAGSFGYPDATARQLAWVGRRHAEAYASAHACCVASRWIADGLIHDGVDHRKIHVTPYGPNHRMRPPETRDWSRPRFLFIGWDWQRKNGPAVLRAFQALRRHRPDAALDVVGHHPPLDSEGVTGHGPLSFFDPAGRSAVERLFIQSTCFVMPSFVEPFGIVYVEAASAGLPSIGTTIGGTADSIGEGGRCVHPEDFEGLLAAMTALCDPETASGLGAAAARRAARLTWRSTAEGILQAAGLEVPADVPAVAN